MKPEKVRILHPAGVYVFALACLLAGCGTTPLKTTDGFIKQYGFHNVSRADFKLCYRYGCQETVSVSINDAEWQPVRDLFSPAPADAAEERELIAKAVQTLEVITGKKTGIDDDIGGTFRAAFKKNQMDCEDEAVNTNIFLILLEQENLLKFNRTYGISRRGLFPVHWPHMAAAVIDESTKEIFVVDSWFFDHGMPVNIVPEKEWLNFWKPGEAEYEKYYNRPQPD